MVPPVHAGGFSSIERDADTPFLAPDDMTRLV
jgi:hypothetical protein